CGALESNVRCGTCGSARLRAVVIGANRTAEELGRAFTGYPIRTSGGKEVLATVTAQPALVVATPGAEPVADGGYGAALLLDGWALLGRQDLRAAEEALRRWMAAAALVRPAAEGGRVVVGADSGLAPAQALIRWDPGWHAARELADRTELGFPPAMRMASVQAGPKALAAHLLELSLPESAEVLGPVPVDSARSVADGELQRALIRVPRADGRALAGALSAAQARRSARKDPEQVRVQLDALDLI
ncbi:MAG: primosome assembly protein PriA, partial [Pseudonocardiaceae bacterium]